ncbi:hemolysin family protein [Pseudodesulfovibrio senegalensis]|jgi:CBS domain containing-hemolysin-like protein|uniref:HlyC/CorC family transporter n=1 Tax=Pseudodesulfovibrio senegalensis TaxID=1721087 RepID=A0A6N6N740_9BACT|nr:hemolysin family protein [Pseudodesulfovibrio senegalensis]KAB1443259.1 HlyC/CorC family transporter [Pseudodesulfovibrio senegalensis]
MLELILAVGLAVFVSTFCSLAEAALYSLPWSQVERLKRCGKKSGAMLECLRNNVEEPITAILTLNTVAHTAGAAVAGWAWADIYGEDTLWLFTLVFTLVILIISEILPKTIGVVYNDAIAPPLASTLRVLVWVFKPAVMVLGLVAAAIRGSRKSPEHSEADILAVASLTRRSGVIKPYEEQSIRNILLLDDKSVEQVMTPRTVVFSLSADMTVAEARESHPVWPHSRVPVFGDDNDDIVGIVYRRQVFEALADDHDELKLSDLMRPVRFVLESLTLDQVLVKFLGSRMHLFVVLDEYGGMAGVISLEDVLEEILGNEIVDETDQVVDMRELARMRRGNLVQGQGEDDIPPVNNKE